MGADRVTVSDCAPSTIVLDGSFASRVGGKDAVGGACGDAGAVEGAGADVGADAGVDRDVDAGAGVEEARAADVPGTRTAMTSASEPAARNPVLVTLASVSKRSVSHRLGRFM